MFQTNLSPFSCFIFSFSQLYLVVLQLPLFLRSFTLPIRVVFPFLLLFLFLESASLSGPCGAIQVLVLKKMVMFIKIKQIRLLPLYWLAHKFYKSQKVHWTDLKSTVKNCRFVFFFRTWKMRSSFRTANYTMNFFWRRDRGNGAKY